MTGDSQSPQPPRSGRTKTQLACDVCRRRKSRCDGRRPSCSHCLEIGAACNYRTISANVESDTSLLPRLTAIEGRLETLEERLSKPAESQATSSLIISEKETPESSGFHRIPEFHHGAGHKVLQYWSRLRVHLTIPDVEVLQFLKNAEDNDVRFTENLSPELAQASLPLSLAVDCLHVWDEILSQIPIGFSVLLESSIYFSTEHISTIIESLSSSRQSGLASPLISDLPLQDLLIYSVALRWMPDVQAVEMSHICFTIALQRLWRVQMEADEITIPYLLVVAHIFLYIYARPFHAMGMLQIVDSAINRLSGHSDSRSLESSVLIFSRIFYLLQSDILSEIDGTPSIRIPPGLPSSGNIQQGTITNGQLIGYDYFTANMWLRSCLNRILAHMFITGQAYCQPREVSPVIAEICSDIETWYRALPLELQFVRDARSFAILMPHVSTRVKELSLRYHACISILTRPVLYFVLYQDLENGVTPSPGSNFAIDRHLEPWVFALCRDCIESCKVIIMTLAQHLHQFSAHTDAQTPFSPQFDHASSGNRYGPTWCDIQLLVGSYAVLISVQNASSFSSTFRDVSNIDEILDVAEGVLARVTGRSLGYTNTLDILTNIRHNFRTSTPGTGASC